MQINDRIYGNFEVSDPLALEIIESPSFQRLKSIAQVGIPNEYYHLVGCSRYDHSVGVYILLNKLGADRDECLAGLLHDVSHLAFSHLADWVMGDTKKEDIQDKRHFAFIKASEIAFVLNRSGFSVEKICDYHRYPLLEKEIPDICADRIDYSLRESDPTVAEATLPFMATAPHGIVFTEKAAATAFASNFLDRQERHWGGYDAMTRYAIMSELLKRALTNKDITETDFDMTDEFIINKIKAKRTKEYDVILDILKNKDLSGLPKAQNPIVKKFRYVDPKILIGEKTIRLSEIDANFKTRLEEARAKNQKGIRAGVMPA